MHGRVAAESPGLGGRSFDVLRYPLAILALLSPLLVSSAAEACACCSDSGYRREQVAPFSAYERSMLSELAWDSKPQLYSDDSDQAAKGIDDTESSAYTLTVSEKNGVLSFAFVGDKGKAGALVLARPKNLDSFVVDPLDGPNTGNGPTLYKEWRLDAPVTGTGIFQRGLGKHARARLVLHGRGLRCDEASQFTRWSLHVKSGSSHYSFFGKLRKK